MTDPTYVRAEIDARPEWKLAFRLSEVDNDHAPIGWARYITLAFYLLKTFDMTERPAALPPTEPRAMTEPPYWQPIESAPQDGTLVLVYYREGGMAARRFAPPRRGEVPRWVDALGHDAGLPMYWMPLPAPPAARPPTEPDR